MEKYDTAREDTDINIIRRIRIACWIPKAANTHSVYVILIAFPLQHWLYERASTLRYTYIACPVFIVPYIVLYIITSDLEKLPVCLPGQARDCFTGHNVSFDDVTSVGGWEAEDLLPLQTGIFLSWLDTCAVVYRLRFECRAAMLLHCSFRKCAINPLNTKRRLLYLKTQFVPRSKHFSSRL